MHTITVKMREKVGEKYICDAVVSDGDEALTYEVFVTTSDHLRLTKGNVSVEDLVKKSFLFLLARESKDAIMRSFDLMMIARYFPEYENEIMSEMKE